MDEGVVMVEYYDATNMFLPNNNTTTDVDEIEQDDELYSFAVSPNPTSLEMKLDFMLEEPGMVEIVAVDVTGREQKELVNQYYANGKNSVTIDVSHFLRQQYLISFKVHGKKITRMVIFK
jgi:hypothetical protein